MSIDFSVIKKKHVEDACRRIIEEGVPKQHQGRSTFVQYQNHELPAKYVLGMAYEIATGKHLSPDDFSGGLATAKVLDSLGFGIKYSGPVKKQIKPKTIDKRDALPSNKGKFKIVRTVLTEGHLPENDAAAAEKLLLNVFNNMWIKDRKAVFLLTPGGFLRFHMEGTWKGNRAWKSTPEDIKPFVMAAKEVLHKAITKSVLNAAKGKTDYLSIGIDGGLKDGVQAELVALIKVNTGKILNWTGKSYPTLDQERKLVQVADLKTHFIEVGQERVMILGCHDLSMFSPRGEGNQIKGGSRWKRCREMRKMTKRFKPNVILQHPHKTDTPKTWRQSWIYAKGKYFHAGAVWASGIFYKNKISKETPRKPLARVLEGTRSDSHDVWDIIIK